MVGGCYRREADVSTSTGGSGSTCPDDPPEGERFLNLTWGDVGAGGSFTMFRRPKLMIADIKFEMLAAAERDGVLVASLSLTDERGCPRVTEFRPKDTAARCRRSAQPPCHLAASDEDVILACNPARHAQKEGR
jgi:hypothetical protein